MIFDGLISAFIMLLHLWIINVVVFAFWKYWRVHRNWYWPPLDFGITFFDKRRIFGAHKSFLNFPIIFFVGSVVGYFLSSIKLGLVYGLGFIIGTFLLSFIKRRLNLKPGDKAFLLDQTDYLWGTIISFYLFKIEINILVFFAAFLISIPAHIIGNKILFNLNIKDVPW